ncbi:hypothetical protein [Helicobacter apodemus]|nr:hypothetical protein [Helicobacter apodemus]
MIKLSRIVEVSVAYLVLRLLEVKMQKNRNTSRCATKSTQANKP